MSNPYDKPTMPASSVLGPTLKFKGELTANEDLLIQGQVEGSINHTSNLTIGKEGRIKANVKAEYICIEGKVNGDLSGSKAIVVKEGADVKGNIFSPTVTLHEGSAFNGSIDMTGKERPVANSPENIAETNNNRSKSKAVDTDKPDASDNKSKRDKKRSASAA